MKVNRASSAISREKPITVLNPRGNPPPITLVPMAPRLDTLDGKTIYIVWVGLPETYQWLEELKRILDERYPQANWELKKKGGVYGQHDSELWAEIKEKGDAMVMAVAQLGSRTPFVVNCCSTLEKLGVPTTAVVNALSLEIAKIMAYAQGIPAMRFAYVPHPVTQVPVSVCREHLEGNDPITGRPVIQEIVDALTKPLTDEEKKTGIIERPITRLLGPDTPENLEHLFHENGWTDKLPIVLPTPERVAEMLKGTSHKPDEVVGKMNPFLYWEEWSYTVEQVAINAVMAGAKPEHLPVILAIASTGINSFFVSGTSFVQLAVVNGPIRNEIKMNYLTGALGPFNEANAVIGRAWQFISRNLGGGVVGGGVPKITYLGVIGNQINFNNGCFAENEEALPPGWKPLSVQRGYKPNESIVSLFRGHSLIGYGGIRPYPISEIMRRGLLSLDAMSFGTTCTFLLSPLTVKDLVRNEGFDTKEKLSQWLIDNTFIAMWNYWLDRPDDLKAAKSGIEPFASLFKLPEEALSPLPLVPKGTPVEIILVGEEMERFWQFGNFRCITSASVDNWR